MRRPPMTRLSRKSSRRAGLRPMGEGLERRELLTASVVEFPLTAPGSSVVGGLTTGPDSNLWFTLRGSSPAGDAVGTITPEGAVSESPLPVGDTVAGLLAMDTDG